MKPKLSLLFLVSFVFYLGEAQIPQGFNYQAIARDDDGNLITSSFYIKVEIQNLAADTVFWIEEHNVTPNEYGLISFVVGQSGRIGGTATNFSDIDWVSRPRYLKTSANQGSGYTLMGTTQIWAVPYSLVSKNVEGPVEKLGIRGTTINNNEALFEVKNKDNKTVFAVYNQGVQVFFDDSDKKSPKGGFSVGGFGTVKGPVDYMFVSKDSIRMYIDDLHDVKGVKGGFAIGGYGLSKGAPGNLLHVTSDSTRIYINQSSALAVGTRISEGFAVKGYNSASGIATKNYLATTTNNLSGVGQYNTYLGYESGQSNTAGSYNSFIGYQSGKSNTTGESNVFIGAQSGINNVDGPSNVFIGDHAGYANTGLGADPYFGGYNVFIGYLSGYYNTDGQSNVFVGKQAGFNNTKGRYNTFLGQNTGGQNQAGNFNTYLGAQAAESKKRGNNNVFIGTQAGGGNLKGSGNVFIGYQAGYSEQDSGLLYIENTNSLFPLIGGDFDADKVAINGKADAAGATLQVNGNLRVGNNGSSIEAIIKTMVWLDLPSIPASTSYTVTLDIANTYMGSTVLVSPYLALDDGLVISYARVSATGKIEIKIMNSSGSAIDMGNMPWYVTVIQ